MMVVDAVELDDTSIVGFGVAIKEGRKEAAFVKLDAQTNILWLRTFEELRLPEHLIALDFI